MILANEREQMCVDPTLVVGLGGSGVLTCQWLHALVEELFGEIPPFLKIVAFDSDVQETEGPSQIPDADFFNLFEHLNLSTIIRDFKQNPRFHKKLSWIGDMPLDATMADRGCQGLSRLGRVVFFEKNVGHGFQASSEGLVFVSKNGGIVDRDEDAWGITFLE